MERSSNSAFIELVKSGDVAAVAAGKADLREFEQNMDASPSYLIAAAATARWSSVC